MDFEEKSDLELIKSVLDGNIKEYEKLVVRYEKMMYTLAILKLRNRKSAVAVSQECFVTAYRGLASCHSKDSFAALVYRIFSSLIQNRLKKNICGGESEKSIPAKNRTELIQSALMSMPAEWSESIVLRDIGGLNYGQISVLLKTDAETVRNLLFAARTELKRILSKGIECSGVNFKITYIEEYDKKS